MKKNQRAALATLWKQDAYKIGHLHMFAPGTSRVLTNFTARGSRIDGVDKTVFFGLQAYLRKIFAEWDEFFALDELELDEVLEAYDQRVVSLLGASVGTDHLRALWELGYLPLRFNALPEGSRVPLRVPFMTVENTHPDFYWLPTAYFETDLSAHLWQPITSATTSHRLREMLNRKARKAGLDAGSSVAFIGHDFSYRGLTGDWAIGASGAAHLLSFLGSDNLPAEDFALDYYDEPTGMVSVPATEHAVMMSSIPDATNEADRRAGEFDQFDRLLDTFPNGFLSVVSDTFDLWRVLTDFLPRLKDKVLARNGRLVIRPDSGDPELILCGDPDAPEGSPQRRGVVGLLYDEFGGTEENGYITLNDHVGAIYGDSITYDRADSITDNLMRQGFSPLSVVFGIGSYNFQYQTRDTFGMAMKATWALVNGEPRDLLKDPITDSGVKKSATGRLAVLTDDDGELYLVEKASIDDEERSELRTVVENGEWKSVSTYSEIRNRLARQN